MKDGTMTEIKNFIKNFFEAITAVIFYTLWIIGVMVMLTIVGFIWLLERLNWKDDRDNTKQT